MGFETIKNINRISTFYHHVGRIVKDFFVEFRQSFQPELCGNRLQIEAVTDVRLPVFDRLSPLQGR
jgi:hypothetical protein